MTDEVLAELLAKLEAYELAIDDELIKDRAYTATRLPGGKDVPEWVTMKEAEEKTMQAWRDLEWILREKGAELIRELIRMKKEGRQSL